MKNWKKHSTCANLPIEIIRAMGTALKPCFAPKFREALNHEKQQARIAAIFGLLGLLDEKNLEILRIKKDNTPSNSNAPNQ